MSVVRNQQMVFLRLIGHLRARWRCDLALPREIQRLLTAERAFGSRDRRLYRELIYTALRFLPWIEGLLDSGDGARAAKIVAWLASETRDTSAYRAELCADWPDHTFLSRKAEFLNSDVSALLPDWFREENPSLFGSPELETQLSRTPLWLRLQTENPNLVIEEFARRKWRIRVSDPLESAWRVLGDADVTQSNSFTNGALEIQDLGSQLILESIGIKPGERWLDACAGAGGKTLQLARLVGAGGAVEAHDIRPAALEELRRRANRAGLRNVSTSLQPTAGGYAGVLVDAPCSGSGTWRRAPHLKWATTPEIVASRARMQDALLAQYAGLVSSGGRLVYATCSLARSENEAIIVKFLREHSDFGLAPFARSFGFSPGNAGMTIFPSRHDTDGFFVASLKRG